MKKLLFVIMLMGCNEYNMDWGNAACTAWCSTRHPDYGTELMAGKDESGHCVCERIGPSV